MTRDEDDLFSEENRRLFAAMKAAEEERIKLYGKPESSGARVLSSLLLDWETIWKMDELIRHKEARKKQHERTSGTTQVRIAAIQVHIFMAETCFVAIC